MKLCIRCKNERENSCFSPDKKTIDKLASWCKICFSEYRKERYTKSKEEKIINNTYNKNI